MHWAPKILTGDKEKIMNKKLLTLFVVCLLVGLYCSSVFAMTPMGLPTAGLTKGQYSVGAEYSYSDQLVDFDYRGGSGVMADFTKHNLRISAVTGRLGYGITDDWEGYINLGVARAKASENMARHSADGMVYGFGTKATLHEDDQLKWGGLVQVKWLRLNGDAISPPATWEGDLDLDMMQIQVAVGPTYQLEDDLLIYGGPIWYYLDGQKKYRERTDATWFERYDMANRSEFGGYIGLQMDVCTDAKMNIEYQKTGDNDTVCAGLLWPF
jgi:hypothetical protein